MQTADHCISFIKYICSNWYEFAFNGKIPIDNRIKSLNWNALKLCKFVSNTRWRYGPLNTEFPSKTMINMKIRLHQIIWIDFLWLKTLFSIVQIEFVLFLVQKNKQKMCSTFYQRNSDCTFHLDTKNKKPRYLRLSHRLNIALLQLPFYCCLL